MKTIATSMLVLFSICVLSQTVKQKKNPVVISVTDTTWTTTAEVIHTYYSSDKALGAFTGGAIGYYLFGGSLATIGGAMVGESASDMESKTYTTYEKKVHHGYNVKISDGYTFTTEDNIYKKGQIVIYQK